VKRFAREQAAAASTMLDTCIVHSYSAGATDSYGVPGAGYTAGAPTVCGYKARSSREVQQGNETAKVDAELRLPHGTAVKSLDRMQLTHRYGDALTPTLLFDVVGQPASGLSAIVVNLVTKT